MFRRYFPLAVAAAVLSLPLLPARANMHDGRGMREFEAGMLLVRQGKWVEAIPRFNEALSVDPQFAEAYLFRGLGRMTAKDVNGADEDYTSYVTLRPDAAAGFMQRGTTRLAQGRPAEAEADFKEGGRLGGHAVNMYRGLGDCEMNLRHYNEAITDYSEAIKLAPQSPTLFQRRSVAFQNAGDQRQASADAAQSDALVRSGHALEPKDEVSEVEEQAFAGMAGHPGAATPTVVVPGAPPTGEQIRGQEHAADARAAAAAASSQATTLAQRGDLPGAIQQMAVATSQQPQEPRYWTIKAAFEEQAGQIDPAVNDYVKALSIDNKDADAHLGLAVSYAQQRKNREARGEIDLGLQGAHRPQIEGALSMATNAASAEPSNTLLQEIVGRLTTARGTAAP